MQFNSRVGMVLMIFLMKPLSSSSLSAAAAAKAKAKRQKRILEFIVC